MRFSERRQTSWERTARRGCVGGYFGDPSETTTRLKGIYDKIGEFIPQRKMKLPFFIKSTHSPVRRLYISIDSKSAGAAPHPYKYPRMCVRDRERRARHVDPRTVWRALSRAICCFYDLEDYIAASSDTLSRLPSSVVPFRPRSLATGRRVLHHPNPRGVREYEPGIHRRYTRVRY